jgi:hypothetical protein
MEILDKPEVILYQDLHEIRLFTQPVILQFRYSNILGGTLEPQGMKFSYLTDNFLMPHLTLGEITEYINLSDDNLASALVSIRL